MPTPGPLELVIILVIALLILGPGKLPDVGAALGKSIREFRKASSDVQEAVNVNVDTSPLPPPVTDATPPPAPAPTVAPEPAATAPAASTGTPPASSSADSTNPVAG
jgi:sec-independent protein translocase protein TatA